MSSLAALTATATAPIFAYVIVGERLALTVLGLALILFFQHRENIARLLKGTEPTIGGDKKAE
jgi:glycerol-3-phosphate acyltransferase PlsY